MHTIELEKDPSLNELRDVPQSDISIAMDLNNSQFRHYKKAKSENNEHIKMIGSPKSFEHNQGSNQTLD